MFFLIKCECEFHPIQNLKSPPTTPTKPHGCFAHKTTWVFPKNRGIWPPKWMVKIIYNGKPYEQIHDLGGFSHYFWVDTHMLISKIGYSSPQSWYFFPIQVQCFSEERLLGNAIVNPTTPILRGVAWSNGRLEALDKMHSKKRYPWKLRWDPKRRRSFSSWSASTPFETYVCARQIGSFSQGWK